MTNIEMLKQMLEMIGTIKKKKLEYLGHVLMDHTRESNEQRGIRKKHNLMDLRTW